MRIQVAVLVCGLLLALSAATGGIAPATVACRVLEVHRDAATQVTIAVFHHRDAKDQARLGQLLRAHPEAAVEFQMRDGNWHAAGVARLKSCFGRGLLIVPPGGPPLAAGDEFLLKFPAAAAGR